MSTRFRNFNLLLAAALLIVCSFGACRSGSNAVKPSKSAWTTLSIPLKARLIEPSRKSFSGRAYFRRGESVYVSIRVLGFEAASVYIDRDSIRAFEKLKSSYISVPSSIILDRRGMSMEKLQEMMLGIGQKSDSPITVNIRPGLDLRIDWSDPVPVAIVGSMASSVALSSTVKNRPVSATVEWRTNDAEWNVDIPDWRAPSHPRRIEPSALFKLLNSF